MEDHQVNALALLLQAIQCKTLIEQEKVIVNEESQSVLQHAKECSSSLISLVNVPGVETNSILSEDTHALSTAFEFDSVLMATPIYETARRSHVRRLVHLERALAKAFKQRRVDGHALSRDESSQLIKGELESGTLSCPAKKSTVQFANRNRSWWKLSIPRPASTMRTGLLHDTVSEDAAEAKILKVLMLGAGASGKSTLLKGLRLLSSEHAFSTRERLQWREIILYSVAMDLRDIIGEMEELGITLGDGHNEQHKQTVFSLRDDVEDFLDHLHPPILRLACAVKSLWLDPEVQSCWRKLDYQHGNFRYFLKNLHRLGDLEYIPSHEDILRSRLKTTGISETRLKFSPAEVRLFDVAGVRSERKLWGRVFDNVSTLIFVVDATGYKKCLLEDRNGNHIRESLMLFGSLVKSKYFRETFILLLFTRADEIHEELEQTSVLDYFADCPADSDGHTSVTAYWQWLENRFLALVPEKDLSDKRIKICKTSLVDPSAIGAQQVFRILTDWFFPNTD